MPVPVAIRGAVRTAVLTAALLAACGTGTGGSSAPATSAPVATAQAATSPAPASASTGGVDIAAILGGNHTAPASTTWVRVSDPASPFSYEVPSSWTMHAAYPWEQAGATVGIALAAGEDLSKLSTDFSVRGIVVGVSGATTGMTPRQVVEGDGGFDGVCTASPVQEASEAGGTVAYQLWRSCGGGTGVLLVMAIAATGQQGLVGIVFQGASEDDLGYLDHIVRSLSAEPVQATRAPAASGGSVTGPGYTISMDVCQNQHGQGVSGGLIRNDDTLIHSWRIVVEFSDPNGVFLNDTGWTTSDLQPGVTARWQATVPSGLPAVSVACKVSRVELIR